MSAFSGRYYRGAMRDRRHARRAAAEQRHATERARNQARAMCHGKRRYATRGAATFALLDCKIRFALRRNDRRREQRTYLCPTCSGFHLTSRPTRRPAPLEGTAA